MTWKIEEADGKLKILVESYSLNHGMAWDEYVVSVESGPEHLQEDSPTNALRTLLEKKIAHDPANDPANDQKVDEQSRVTDKDQQIQELKIEKEQLALQMDTMQIELQDQMTKYVALQEQIATTITTNNKILTQSPSSRGGRTQNHPNIDTAATDATTNATARGTKGYTPLRGNYNVEDGENDDSGSSDDDEQRGPGGRQGGRQGGRRPSIVAHSDVLSPRAPHSSSSDDDDDDDSNASSSDEDRSVETLSTTTMSATTSATMSATQTMVAEREEVYITHSRSSSSMHARSSSSSVLGRKSLLSTSMYDPVVIADSDGAGGALVSMPSSSDSSSDSSSGSSSDEGEEEDTHAFQQTDAEGYDQKWAALLKQHEEEMLLLKQEHATTLEETIAALTTKMTASHATYITTLIEKHTSETHTLIETHTSETNTLIEKHTTEIKFVKDTHDERKKEEEAEGETAQKIALDVLNAKHQEEIVRLNTEHETQVRIFFYGACENTWIHVDTVALITLSTDQNIGNRFGSLGDLFSSKNIPFFLLRFL